MRKKDSPRIEWFGYVDEAVVFLFFVVFFGIQSHTGCEVMRPCSGETWAS